MIGDKVEIEVLNHSDAIPMLIANQYRCMMVNFRFVDWSCANFPFVLKVAANRLKVELQ